VRNINETFMAVTPFAAVARACPSPSAVPAPESVVTAVRSVVVATTPWSAVVARPWSGVEATGAGYAAGGLGIATRRGVDRDALGAKRSSGMNGKQNQLQDQLHLMSRRDPRTWRPPA
jgi:hypothetical protein